jgi:drug/metabolite transporter superfamily protein YnfA
MAKQDRVEDFVQQAGQAQVGLVRELWAWLRHNKKWWLSPVVVLLLFISFLVFLSSTAIAPFIYTLF